MKPVTVSWLRRELQIDELSQEAVRRGLGEQSAGAIRATNCARPLVPESLPRLAAWLQPEPLDAPRWLFKDIVDWFKQIGFREPEHSIRLSS